MKTSKTFQPFVILIALTIHQIFFITFTSSKMPFNISNIMYQEKTKDKKSESYLISNVADVYASDKFAASHNESKRSRIPFMDFFHELFIGQTKSPDGELGSIKTAENAADLAGDNYKNRLPRSAATRQKITSFVSARKKRTKSNRLLKKFHRDFRHMRKKWSMANGLRTSKRDEKFLKRKTSSTDNSTGEHKRQMEDFSKNRYKRTTVQGNFKPRYLAGSRNQFDLSREYPFEYKIKDGNGGNTRSPNDTTDVTVYNGTTERNFLNFLSHLVDSDLPGSRSGNISNFKRNGNIIPHPINRAVPYGNFERSRAAVNFSSAVSEAYKSAQKRIMKWPIKRVVSVEGDIIIGGLMMVHSRGEGDKLCGPVMAQGGVQALEVMLYTLKMINMNPHIPFRIGAHILDDCDTDTYGLEMALDFIKANLHYLDDGRKDSQCSEVTKPIWGVVGAPSSITSIQVSNLLRLFKIPMISPFSTSPELSNKHKYDYFCRTIPSDYYQVQVIAKIIDRLKWTYVSVIYEESNYGIKGLEELEKVLNERKICVAIKEKVLKDSGVPNEAFYDKVVARLLTKPLARGVIVFASDQEVAGIMRAVKRLNITERFSWIGSDGWSARNLVSDGNEEVVEGTISVQPQANPVKGFREYFFNRTPSEHVNPYFAEFWETRFECRLPFVPDTPFNGHFNKSCDPSLSLGLHNVEIENQLQFVHQATCGFCQALINMHTDFCGKDFKGVCDKMWNNRGPTFLEYIRRVNFTDFSGDGFRFDDNGDGPARYNIIHYKQTSRNIFKWVNVGEYENGVLNLNVKELQFKMENTEMPPSSCSQVCNKGEVKKYINGDKCCWKCNSCSKYEVVLPSDETECKRCVLGTKPNEDRKSCVDLEPLLMKSELYTLSITGSTAFGFFNVVTTFMVYVCNFNSAIVRASSREAQILVLTGALFLHANAYSFLLDPDEVVCSMQSYFSGIGYILIYGTLFWKSYRIVRIFDLSSHYKNMNSSAFILLVLGLCCIQKIKSVIWTYFIDPRKVTFYYPDEDTKIKLCSAFTTLEIGYFIAYIFPLTSIIFCYLRTKKITNTPKIFNDSPQIFFSIRFTIISWIAMFIMHFMTYDIPLRQNILAIVTNLNGIGIVFALFYRSMFIIIFRPQLNTREYLRASRANHTMKTSHHEDSQAIARDTISQLVMNELSGECSYNNYDSNIQISTPNESSKCESTKREVSVQVSEHYLSPRRRKKSPSFDRASSVGHIEEMASETEKTNKHVAFSDISACKSESNISQIQINCNQNNFDSEPSSSELTAEGSHKKILAVNRNRNKDKNIDNSETKNEKIPSEEDFSSNESIHEMFIEEKCIEGNVEECATADSENVCNQVGGVEKAQTIFHDKENVNLESSRVYFKVVACVDNANVSELGYMTLIVDSKVDGV